MSQGQTYIELTQKLLNKWQREKVLLNPGATEQELAHLEAVYHISLPDDFRYLYAQVNGMQDGLSDEHLFSLWPLQEIMRHPAGVIYPVPESREVIQVTFGDFCIDAHRYLLNCDQHGDWSVMAQLNKDEKIADNFTHFLELYLSQPEDICLW